MNREDLIKVWDLPVRVFHWSLVLAFSLAYLTEDDILIVHTLAGYTVAGLVAFRLFWGVVGSRHARFSDFVRPPGEILAYLKDITAFRAKSYLGHNPAGGAMIIALLISLILTTVTGLAVYGAKEMAGPLAEAMAGVSPFVGDLFEAIHEFFAHFTLLLVVLHIVGVILASLQHGENLVCAMFTGYKQRYNQ